MSIRYGLLALLAEEPRHGYELKTAFERRTGGQWALNIGQVYTTLQRLERDGLVERLGDGDERQDYRVTSAGQAQLEEWFAAVAATDLDVSALVQRQRRASLEQLQAYTRRKARAHPVDDIGFLLMLDALIFRTEAEIRWLDAVEARIRHSANAARGSTQ